MGGFGGGLVWPGERVREAGVGVGVVKLGREQEEQRLTLARPQRGGGLGGAVVLGGGGGGGRAVGRRGWNEHRFLSWKRSAFSLVIDTFDGGGGFLLRRRRRRRLGADGS